VSESKATQNFLEKKTAVPVLKGELRGDSLKEPYGKNIFWRQKGYGKNPLE